jgi:Na+-translocating ferredoxin:NAD+ oxidoreductase RNF subunit RnfB
MNPIVIAALLLCVLGVLGALLLVAASKFLAVTEDERVERLQMVLPGANCGGCGYAGCAAYAKAVAEGAPVNQCSVGGQAVAEKLGAIMGVEAGEATRYKAMVACQGDARITRYEYQGIPTCRACNTLFNGSASCPFGCLGFGDCAAACPVGAITVSDGASRIDPDKCIGCGKCKQVCPKKIIHLYHEDHKPVVMCSNHKLAVDTRKECKAGCIGCGKCERNCPAQAITVRENVARIDYDKCIGCQKCVTDCPVHAIKLPPAQTPTFS